MPYKAFPILDMRVGKMLALAPWLLPQDGFENLRNCHLRRGVLEKRLGYNLFGQIVHIATTTLNPTLQTNPVTGIMNFQDGATENLLVSDKSRINKFVSSRVIGQSVTAVADQGGAPNVVRFTSAGNAFVADDIVTISGTTNYDATYRVEVVAAGSFDVESAFVSETLSGATATQEPFLDITKNKIRFDDAAQSGYTPAADDVIEQVTSGAKGTVDKVVVDYGTFGAFSAHGTIIFQKGTVTGTFNGTDQLFQEGVGANIVGDALAAASDEEFTGNNDDYLIATSWLGRAYIANNNDPIQVYDGTDLVQLSIDIGTDAARVGANDINSCKLIFIVKERVVLLSTNETGTDRLQRARWSTIGDPQSWPTSNFKDAPTEDVIVSADFINDDLYVWFETSVWRLAYTGDATDPFEWERISDSEGSVARMSVVTQEAIQFAVGASRLQISDGRNVNAGDRKIPDFVLDWTQDSLPFSQGLFLNEEKQIWESYASASASANADGNIYPDSALVLNIEDNSFATYGLPIHTLGFSSVESDLTWNDITDAWEVIDSSWNARSGQSGFPTTLMGSQDGKVYQLNNTGGDDGSAIEFSALSGRWNPWIKQGIEASLGWIDFFVDVDESISFDVNSFVNTDSASFQTKTITCSAVRGSDARAWHRVYVHATAYTHRIELTNNALNDRPRIHAIVPYFKPAGSRVI